MINKKIVSLNSLTQKMIHLKKEGKKIVFTNGCFDLLHIGHVHYLNAAKKKGHILIVALNSDSSVKRLKGPTRPINTLKDRMTVISALECVDFVTSFSDDTPLKLIEKLKPTVLVKGGDWKPSQIVGAKEVLGWGGKVFSLPFVKGKSTTRTLNKINSANNTDS